MISKTIGSSLLKKPRRGLDRVLHKIIPYPTYWKLAKWFAIQNRSFGVESWSHSTDPYKYILVDPSEIIYNTNREWKPWSNRSELFGEVMDGDWDQPERDFIHRSYPEKFENGPEFELLIERFVGGTKWEDTKYAKWSAKEIKQGRGRVGDKSKEDLLERLHGYDKLYHEIIQSGYQSQFELSKDRYERKEFRKCVKKELVIDIGRDGELLFVDGRHRLGFAKLLELDQIPVMVLVRHSKWMEKRQAIADAQTVEAVNENLRPYLDHPDLVDVRPPDWSRIN